MRVAIYDNMANNAYIQAKILRRHRFNVDLIVDSQDKFVMSDPRWEELRIEVPSAEIFSFKFPKINMPSWIRNLDSTINRYRKVSYLIRHPRAILWGFRYGGVEGLRFFLSRSQELNLLSHYDLLITYGLGPILAASLGKKFIAETWGGDITLVPFFDLKPGQTPFNRSLSKMQRQGYRSALRIFMSEPRYFKFAKKLNLSEKSIIQPMLVDIDRYSPAKTAASKSIRQKYLKNDKKYLLFIPSRQDWVWKGSDQVFKALAKLKRNDFVALASGWGNDYDKSVQLVNDLGLMDRVVFSKVVYSKRRLLDYYRAADVIFDQFTLKSHGTSTLESMSTAVPLITSLDFKEYAKHYPELPPILNAGNPEEIKDRLNEFFNDSESVKVIGIKAREWVKKYHHDKATLTMIREARGI